MLRITRTAVLLVIVVLLMSCSSGGSHKPEVKAPPSESARAFCEVAKGAISSARDSDVTFVDSVNARPVAVDIMRRALLSRGPSDLPKEVASVLHSRDGQAWGVLVTAATPMMQNLDLVEDYSPFKSYALYAAKKFGVYASQLEPDPSERQQPSVDRDLQRQIKRLRPKALADAERIDALLAKGGCR